jgi:hypothetical protein
VSPDSTLLTFASNVDAAMMEGELYTELLAAEPQLKMRDKQLLHLHRQNRVYSRRERSRRCNWRSRKSCIAVWVVQSSIAKCNVELGARNLAAAASGTMCGVAARRSVGLERRILVVVPPSPSLSPLPLLPGMSWRCSCRIFKATPRFAKIHHHKIVNSRCKHPCDTRARTSLTQKLDLSRIPSFPSRLFS